MSQIVEPRWSKPFDPAMKVAGYSGDRLDQWTSFGHALRDLDSFSKEVESLALWMKKSNFDPHKCESAMEMWIEPPADYIGPGWKSPAYSETHEILAKLTDQGYDVRPQWRKFRELMLRIWQALPDFLHGQRVSEEERERRIQENRKASGRLLPVDQSVDSFTAVMRDTELPPDYDPTKPFPQYPIPEDIDESVEKE